MEENKGIRINVKSRRIFPEESAYIYAPFDKGKKALEAEGYRIISLEENARLAMAIDYMLNGNHKNWVKEAIVYIPNKGKFLTKNSPIMIHAEEATNCCQDHKEFYLTDEQVEWALADSILLPPKSFYDIRDGHEVPNEKGPFFRDIPASRMGEDDITRFIFGDFAQKYGDCLNQTRRKSIDISAGADMKEKPFARQILFDGHYIDGCCRSMNLYNYQGFGTTYHEEVRGIRG